jgi:hypothetical protein
MHMKYKKRDGATDTYHYQPAEIRITAEQDIPIGPVFNLYVDGLDATATVRGADSVKLTALLTATPDLLRVAEIAAAFVGMHTPMGVPDACMGKYDAWLEDPQELLAEIMGVIAMVKGDDK